MKTHLLFKLFEYYLNYKKYQISLFIKFYSNLFYQKNGNV